MVYQAVVSSGCWINNFVFIGYLVILCLATLGGGYKKMRFLLEIGVFEQHNFALIYPSFFFDLQSGWISIVQYLEH